MIKFSARGKEFRISKKSLEKYPESMLCILSDPSNNVPIDEINGSIYIDINPFSVNSIIDYYNLDKSVVEISNIYTVMDMKYLGMNVEYIHDVSPFMAHPIIYSKDVVYDAQKPTCIARYYKIHTANDKMIIIDTLLYNAKYLNILDSMIHFDEINNSESPMIIDVYVGVTDTIMNIMLTIMRDGLNWYYEYLTVGYRLFDNYKELLGKIKFDMTNYCKEKDYCDEHYDDWNHCRISDEELDNCEECRKSTRKYVDEILEKNYSDRNLLLQLRINKDIENVVQSMNMIIDGICMKIEKLSDGDMDIGTHELDMKKIIIDYLRIYGICDEYSENQLKNRLDRIKLLGINNNFYELYSNVDIVFFGKDDRLRYNDRDKDTYSLFEKLIKYCDKFKIFTQTVDVRYRNDRIVKENEFTYESAYVAKKIDSSTNTILTNLMREYWNGL